MNMTASDQITTTAAGGVVGVARSLAGLIQEEAPRVEADGAITAATLNALHTAELFRLQVPTELGGAEADLLTALEVVEEVCRADGSAGWTLMAGMANMAIAGAYFDDEAVARIFADPRSVI